MTAVRIRDAVDRDWNTLRGWGATQPTRDDICTAAARLWNERAWALRGYGSWDEAWATEVGAPLQLSREDRVYVHRTLLAAGLSSRAIAVITGVHHGTVCEDKHSTVGNPTVETPEAEPEKRTGLDGRKRVTDPGASAALTARVVALRESGEPMMWAEIGEVLGVTAHTAYQRYTRYRRKYPRPEPPPVTHLPTPQKIANLADTGMTSRQIAEEVGVSTERVRQLARRDGIAIAGDVNRPRGAATIDQQAAVARWIEQMNAALDAADAFMDPADLPPDEVAGWAHQLDDLIRKLRALTRTFRNQTHEGQAHHG